MGIGYSHGLMGIHIAVTLVYFHENEKFLAGLLTAEVGAVVTPLE